MGVHQAGQQDVVGEIHRLPGLEAGSCQFGGQDRDDSPSVDGHAVLGQGDPFRLDGDDPLSVDQEVNTAHGLSMYEKPR